MAADGLQQSVGDELSPPASSRLVDPAGYQDISVPVYATVKGVILSFSFEYFYYFLMFIIHLFNIFFRELAKLDQCHSLAIHPMILLMVKSHIL